MRIAVVADSSQISGKLIAALKDSVELVFGSSLSPVSLVDKYDLAVHLMDAWLDPDFDAIVSGMSWLRDQLTCSLKSNGPTPDQHSALCDQTRDKGSLSVWSRFQVQMGERVAHLHVDQHLSGVSSVLC